MKHHIFGDVKRNGWRVEEAADKDRIVNDVESAKHVTRPLGRPRQMWPYKGVGEVLIVESIKDVAEVDVSAL